MVQSFGRTGTDLGRDDLRSPVTAGIERTHTMGAYCIRLSFIRAHQFGEAGLFFALKLTDLYRKYRTSI